jgi:hypothetical protein
MGQEDHTKSVGLMSQTSILGFQVDWEEEEAVLQLQLLLLLFLFLLLLLLLLLLPNNEEVL